jgi:group I intron endonuclease
MQYMSRPSPALAIHGRFRSMSKCGIYRIRCRVTGKRYIGSSRNIERRWTAHRTLLRGGKYGCWRLQLAWTKHGEDAFQFLILEECAPDQLFAREQFYIDKLRPELNVVRDVEFGWTTLGIEASRIRSASITRCPRGHEYTETNTYLDRKGSRICKRCNAERVSKIYASETPDQREERRRRVKEYYDRQREKRLEKRRFYTKAHSAEKREYDKLHRKEANDRRRRSRAAETPEAHANRLMLKRESYYRSKKEMG